MSFLIAAATRWEAEPLAKGLGLSPAGAGRFAGIIGADPTILVKTGMGAVKTAAVLEKDFVAGDYRLAVSAGLCGALQEGIRTGDVVADAREVAMDYVVALRETAKDLALPFHFGGILHTNVVLGAEKKRRLGTDHRMVACDMETAAVRRWAQARVPVIGVRAILDEIDEELPADAPQGEDAAALARYALAHAPRLPAMIRLGLRSGRAMKTLARFLKAYLEAV